MGKPGREEKRLRKDRRQGSGSDLFAAYLARRPERDPRVLLPRSVLPVVRGAFLFHGVVANGWSLGWLAAFLIAEFFLVVRLAVLGDRFSTGPRLDPELHRRTSLPFQLAWLVVSIAAALFTGQALDRSSRGAWFGFEGGGLWSAPSFGIVAYLALLVVDFLIEGFAARRERRMFVPAGLLQASFFFVALLLLVSAGIFLAGLADGLFGEQGGRAVFALALVLARAGSELAVLWFPLWGHRLVDGGRRSRADVRSG
jgi:hypothetical protein